MKFILIGLEIGSEVVIKLQISRTIIVNAKAVKIAKDRSNSNVELEICKAANELAMLILCETSKSDAIFFKEGKGNGWHTESQCIDSNPYQMARNTCFLAFWIFLGCSSALVQSDLAPRNS
jgi:hypothetical protein